MKVSELTEFCRKRGGDCTFFIKDKKTGRCYRQLAKDEDVDANESVYAFDVSIFVERETARTKFMPEFGYNRQRAIMAGKED